MNILVETPQFWANIVHGKGVRSKEHSVGKLGENEARFTCEDSIRRIPVHHLFKVSIDVLEVHVEVKTLFFVVFQRILEQASYLAVLNVFF